MAIYLGNLSVSDIEQRLGIELKEEERELLKSTHQAKADDIEDGKWHCFDIPFIISCGDVEMAGKIVEILTPYAEQFKQQIQIGLSK